MTQTMTRNAPAPVPPAPRRRSAAVVAWGKAKAKLLGITFLALIVLAGWFTYMQFTDGFSKYDVVTLNADRIGLQLPDKADVKVRGLIVGEVLEQKATAHGAELKLGLFPDKRAGIDPDVTGAILPKTLFGEKYVSLIPSDSRFSHGIEPGAVIHKTKIATELQSVIRDLYPLLRTVQPADLNATLNAMATALDGRGEEIGKTLTTLDSYLKRINPKVPALVQDLKMLTNVSNTYKGVMPELSSIIQHSIVTTTTLEQREAKVRSLLTDVTAFSNTADGFLDQNGDTLIQLGKVSEPVTKTLARYSPEFPCLLGGLDTLGQHASEAFRNYTLHITLETLPEQPRAYGPEDKPVYGDDRGPACGHLPNPPWSQKNPLKVIPNFNDGVNKPIGKGNMKRAAVGAAASSTPFSAMSYVGTDAETQSLNSLIAPSMGVSADQVPGLGALLVAPAARGAEVSLR